MNSYLKKAEPLHSQAQRQTMHILQPDSISKHNMPANLTQTEQETLPQDSSQAIVDLLVKQQNLTTLPPQKIPIFKGDPMEYRLFIRAFEHGVEDKTENNRDRLYFMEQHTDGQPRELPSYGTSRVWLSGSKEALERALWDWIQDLNGLHRQSSELASHQA